MDFSSFPSVGMHILYEAWEVEVSLTQTQGTDITQVRGFAPKIGGWVAQAKDYKSIA